MNKKQLILFGCIFLLTTFVIVGSVEARRGCCSHHGGVCGCRCCDGTPLSAKCAPYYPGCNAKSLPKYYNPNKKSSLTTYDQTDKKEVVYAASVKSNIYHYPWCKWAKRISSYNLITFGSTNDAKAKGYRPCKVCKPPLSDL